MKKNKFNLILMTLTTAPIFLLGFINNSMMITIIGFLLLAFFGFGGLMKMSSRRK